VKGSSGKADFISTPALKMPYNLAQRFKGTTTSASALINYSGGSITSVTVSKSSGSAALDGLIIRHVQRSFRVKPGTSGRATLPIGIRL
jgi:hypothetical protein